MAGSLSMLTGKAVSRNTLAAEMIRALSRLDGDLVENRQEWMDRYRRDCVTIGRAVSVSRAGETRWGQAVDVDDRGRSSGGFRPGAGGRPVRRSQCTRYVWVRITFPYKSKRRINMNEIVQAMVTRRSCRQYWDRPVPEELLDQVLLAGTYAANGRGRQAGRIVVLTKKEDITALEKLNAQALGNPEAQPFYGAPVVLVVLADKSVHTGVEDGSLVIGNMLLAAHALGLGACWIHRAREEFESPEGKTLPG